MESDGRRGGGAGGGGGGSWCVRGSGSSLFGSASAALAGHSGECSDDERASYMVSGCSHTFVSLSTHDGELPRGGEGAAFWRMLADYAGDPGESDGSFFEPSIGGCVAGGGGGGLKIRLMPSSNRNRAIRTRRPIKGRPTTRKSGKVPHGNRVERGDDKSPSSNRAEATTGAV